MRELQVAASLWDKPTVYGTVKVYINSFGRYILGVEYNSNSKKKKIKC